jgi:hypothetical protein
MSERLRLGQERSHTMDGSHSSLDAELASFLADIVSDVLVA